MVNRPFDRAMLSQDVSTGKFRSIYVSCCMYHCNAVVCLPSAQAEPLNQSFDSSVQKRKTRAEKEAEIAAAEAEEEANKENYARVIVLRWYQV